MAIKTITTTIESIAYGRLMLWLSEDGVLHYLQDYAFIDSDGNLAQSLQNATFLEGGIPWVDVPENIRQALTDIDTYVKAEINVQEDIL